jgi:hypothetical protein
VASEEQAELTIDGGECEGGVLANGAHGNKIAPSAIGPENSWGVIHLIGNAKEWVVNDDALLAIGGLSRYEPLNCVRNRAVLSSGKASAAIRVVREI